MVQGGLQMEFKMNTVNDSAVTSMRLDCGTSFIDDGYEVSLNCHGYNIYIGKDKAREIIKFLEKAFNVREKTK